MQEHDTDLLEILNTYMDLAEKQEEVIYRLTQIVKKQANELSHIRSLYGFFKKKHRRILRMKTLRKRH